VLPKPDRAFTRIERALLGGSGAARRAYRWWIYWSLEARALGFTVDPRIMKLAASLGRRHVTRQVRDRALRAAVTPDYLPGCKRILMANDYYPALQRDNVELITEPIDRVSERGIVTRDGDERAVDAIIFGTGFKVTDPLGTMRVHGRGGRELADHWRSEMSAYLGTTVAGFPNFFMLLGPNTGLGHNSMVFMIEAQVHYAMRCMDLADRRGDGRIEVLEEEQQAYNQALQPRLDRAVWASGCKSWYLDASGQNVTAWPSFTVEFWARTRRVIEAHYRLGQAQAALTVPAAVPGGLATAGG
jgi:cation diffusion facilitator CzcD-associated flavoprotein CzcO